MAKRFQLPSYDEIAQRSGGNGKAWERAYLPNTPEKSLSELLEEDKYSDDSFDVEDTSAPMMQNTSSSNPTKPRTTSAGYDYKSETLTVVFRDGTWWEYRGVPLDIWQGFRSAQSKGRYLRDSGLDSWGDMGPADVGAMPVHRRVLLNGTENPTQ